MYMGSTLLLFSPAIALEAMAAEASCTQVHQSYGLRNPIQRILSMPQAFTRSQTTNYVGKNEAVRSRGVMISMCKTALFL